MAAEERLKLLGERLADPEVYADKELMNDLIEQHAKAERDAAKLMADWERAATELESLNS